MYCQVLRF